jgi:LEA14-like dessication related protein
MWNRIGKAVLLGLLVTGACTTLNRSLPRLVVTPVVVGIANVEVRSFDTEKAVILTRLVISNSNPYTLSFQSCAGTLSFGSEKKESMAFSTSETFTLPAQASSSLEVPVTVYYGRLLGLDLSRSNLPYEMKLEAVIRTSLGNIRVPAEYQGVIPLPSMPVLKIERIRFLKFSYGDLKATCMISLSIYNPNSFPLVLGSLSYDFKIDDRDLIRSMAEKSIEVQAYQTAHTALLFDSDLSGLKDVARSIFLGKENPFKIEGGYKFGRKGEWSGSYTDSGSMIIEK